MRLRGIPFQSAFDASGVRNFDGSGWWYHQFLRPVGLNFENSTFVSKTTTLYPRAGNLPLSSDGLTALKYFPDCIAINFWKGCALNAVGLSGPGARVLLEKRIWQNWPEPFFISFMSVAESRAERVEEMKKFVDLLKGYQGQFKAKFGLQINLSCPNVGSRSIDDFVSETADLLEAASPLEIPLMPKLSVTTDVVNAVEISKLKGCDALCVSNTIPWGSFSDKINWHSLFGTDESPLKKYGGGGLSGAPLLPLVERWVREAREKHRISIPINAGGGILRADDVDRMKAAGASSIFVGSAAFLRGWRVRGIINRAHQIFSA